MSPALKRWIVTACCALGLGLSLHLALLKLFALPCLGPGGCHSIIHSGYGSVFGVPVGVYSGLLWTAAILVRERVKRAGLLFLLAGGAAIFMGIQFFILRGFCLYCTAHAVVAWVALAASAEAPKRSSFVLGIVLAGGGFLLARAEAQSRAESLPVVQATSGPLAAAPAGLPWLGPLTPRSPAVVLSLNCAACLDLMDELTRERYGDVRSGPALYFKVTDDTRELTTAFIAAVLSHPGSKRDAFLSATAVLLTVKDQALSAPQQAAVQFGALFPSSAGQREAAERVIAAQTEALETRRLTDTTPLLVPINGKPRAFFRIEELLGR